MSKSLYEILEVSPNASLAVIKAVYLVHRYNPENIQHEADGDDSLIEAVNILGSWFYGTILGVFLVAFYFKNVKGGSVFWAALFAEAFVIYSWWVDLTAFLWLNLIGCVLVILFALVFNLLNKVFFNKTI